MRPSFTPSPELYPFTSRWAETSAGEVHYVDEGQDSPILFLHGNPTWSFLYRHVISALRLQSRSAPWTSPTATARLSSATWDPVRRTNSP